MSRFVIDENFAPGNRGRNTLVLNLGEEIATDDSSTAKGSDIMIYANGNVPSNTNNVVSFFFTDAVIALLRANNTTLSLGESKVGSSDVDSALRKAAGSA